MGQTFPSELAFMVRRTETAAGGAPSERTALGKGRRLAHSHHLPGLRRRLRPTLLATNYPVGGLAVVGARDCRLPRGSHRVERTPRIAICPLRVSVLPARRPSFAGDLIPARGPLRCPALHCLPQARVALDRWRYRFASSLPLFRDLLFAFGERKDGFPRCLTGGPRTGDPGFHSIP